MSARSRKIPVRLSPRLISCPGWKPGLWVWIHGVGFNVRLVLKDVAPLLVILADDQSRLGECLPAKREQCADGHLVEFHLHGDTFITAARAPRDRQFLCVHRVPPKAGNTLSRGLAPELKKPRRIYRIGRPLSHIAQGRVRPHHTELPGSNFRSNEQGVLMNPVGTSTQQNNGRATTSRRLCTRHSTCCVTEYAAPNALSCRPSKGGSRSHAHLVKFHLHRPSLTSASRHSRACYRLPGCSQTARHAAELRHKN